MEKYNLVRKIARRAVIVSSIALMGVGGYKLINDPQDKDIGGIMYIGGLAGLIGAMPKPNAEANIRYPDRRDANYRANPPDL
jgi:hypothetical protein